MNTQTNNQNQTQNNQSNTASQQALEKQQQQPSADNSNNNQDGNSSNAADPNAEDAMPAPVGSFDELGLCEDLLRGIYAYGFERPSVIQQKAILPMLSGRDTIAQAQSGTGKTATFCIALLQKIDASLRRTQAVVLAPTRELAEQSANVCSDFAGPHMKNVSVKVLIGGRRTRDDIHELRTGPQVVIGTPGRVMHMIREGHLRLENCGFFCLDEADQMLSFGFKDQVYEIFQYLPEACQVALVSATMPPEVLSLSDKFMRAPHKILLQRQEVSLEGIKQYQVALDNEEQKFLALCDIFSMLTVSASIIFVNTRRQAEELHRRMEEENFAVSKIHGEMEQAERDLALNDFRLGASRVLISTDVLAKGIDVQGVSVVVNYSLPREKEFYIHRIGRAGRFGRRGVAVSLATVQEYKFLREIESHYSTHIEDLPMTMIEDPTAAITGA